MCLRNLHHVFVFSFLFGEGVSGIEEVGRQMAGVQRCSGMSCVGETAKQMSMAVVQSFQPSRAWLRG